MAEEKKAEAKKSFSLDWLVGGVLTKLGDTFDRFTGRKWNPSSSLATSKLTEKLKFLLDSEVRDLGKDGKFVPHQITLKMQWDKFSSDSEDGLVKLEHELCAAAIDHINDKLYHTYAPLNIKIKTDYFTEGVRMLSSFGKFSDKEDDEVAINVTVPNMNVADFISENKITVNLEEPVVKVAEDIIIARFSANNKAHENELNFTQKKRISIGRSKENALAINDQSVSKLHAALVLGDEKQLMVADTGSTNGTFINGKRIAYGKAVAFDDDAKLKFGTVEVSFERLFVEEEIFDEQVEPLEEFELSGEDFAQEVKPTEASFGTDEKNIPISPVNSGNVIDEILPTQAIVDVTENKVQSNQTEVLETEIKEDSEIKKTEINTTNESKEINIDKTQDWEI